MFAANHGGYLTILQTKSIISYKVQSPLQPCDKYQTTVEYSQNICSRYKLKVRGLSGYGMQIAPSVQDPDRSCRVACQDEYLPHRFYLVNGDQGLFPFGTKCSPKEDRYCVNGKCLVGNQFE